MTQTYGGINLQEVWQRVESVRSLTQSLESAVIAVKMLTSNTYVELMSAQVTMVAGEALLIDFTACASNNSALVADQVFFELTINGTSYRLVGTVMPLGNAPVSVGLIGRVAVGQAGLVAGLNTLAVRWKRVGGGTTKIDPATEGHHAVLRLARVQA